MLTLPSCCRVLAGAVVSLAMASTAAAQLGVDPATYNISLYGGTILGGQPSFTTTTPGNYQFTHAVGNASASIQTSPFTMLTAHATNFDYGVQCFCSSAGATMNYFFRIVGAAGTRVSATFAADMFVSLADPRLDERSVAVSQFGLFSPDGLGQFYDLSGAALSAGPTRRLLQTFPGTTRFNTPVNFTVDANAQYQVFLFAGATTEAPNTADAYIDPVITIDPSQTGYSLLLSPGVSNLGPSATTTVPEPGSFALLGAGMLGVAGFVRRRHRKS